MTRIDTADLEALSPAARAATLRAMEICGRAAAAVDLVSERRFADAEDVVVDCMLDIHELMGALVKISHDERKDAIVFLARAEIMIEAADEAATVDFLRRCEASRRA